MMSQSQKRLGRAAVCAAGAALLCHPLCLAAFGAGAWVGYRGRSWLKQILTDWEVTG